MSHPATQELPCDALVREYSQLQGAFRKLYAAFEKLHRVCEMQQALLAEGEELITEGQALIENLMVHSEKSQALIDD